MAEESNVNETVVIKEHIDTERGRLQQNLNELEYRLRRAVDWRARFNERPLLFVGGSFVAGFVVAFMMGPKARETTFVVASGAPGVRRCRCE